MSKKDVLKVVIICLPFCIFLKYSLQIPFILSALAFAVGIAYSYYVENYNGKSKTMKFVKTYF